MSTYNLFHEDRELLYRDVWLQAWLKSFDVNHGTDRSGEVANICLAQFKELFDSAEDEFLESKNLLSILQHDIAEYQYTSLVEYDNMVVSQLERFLEGLGYNDVVAKFRIERVRVYERQQEYETQPNVLISNL
jgi:hypothetical protein